MAAIGYARVSTLDQDCALQVAALKAAGCNPIRQEQKSGASRAGRSELEAILSFLREGDELVVTRIDRLARSLTDLVHIADEVRDKGASLRALEQPVDTRGSAGRAFLGMLGVFAEFERDLIRERQRSGIEKAKAEGRYRGGKPSVPVDKVRALKAEGVRPVEIARRLGIARASVYRALDEQGEPEAA